jgi:hypothetical protein
MAITNNGIKVTLPTKKIATGFTYEDPTTFTDAEYVRVLELSVPKATVENATPATTLANIIDDVTVGLDKQIDDILAADYNASATVEAFGLFYDIKSNISADNSSDFYTDDAVNYVCTVKLYTKTI